VTVSVDELWSDQRPFVSASGGLMVLGENVETINWQLDTEEEYRVNAARLQAIRDHKKKPAVRTLPEWGDIPEDPEEEAAKAAQRAEVDNYFADQRRKERESQMELVRNFIRQSEPA
jgi:hypothetical protein